MRYLLHFLWKHLAFILFLILELISLALVVNGNRHQSAVFSSMVNKYGGKIFSSYANIRDYFHLKEANVLLSIENAALKEQLNLILLQKDSLNFQSFGVIDTLKFDELDSVKPLFDYIPAKVISNSTNRQQNYLMFDKGRRQGVRENMGIIGPNGIVGVIFETSEEYSSGISLLNIKQKASVKLKKNNELGTLIWDGISPLYGQLDAIENYVPLSIGDTIVTSGFSHIFPGEEIVGTIADFHKIPGKTSWYIKVKYTTDFNKLFWVKIVRNLNYEQQVALEAIELEN